MEDKLLEATESTVATMIGEAYTGEPPETTSEGDAKFEFDAEFQSRITALALRDNEFMRRAAHLVKPEFFENAGEASLVNIAVKYYEKYKHVPDIGIYATLIKEQIVSKVIRKDIIDLVKDAFKAAIKANIELCRDAIVFFTACGSASGYGGHTGGAFDTVPEVCLFDAFFQAR